MPKAGAAPVAPVERAWAVPTLELYQAWWVKTEECSGLRGDMSQVTFYAVDSPSGAISLGAEVAHGWWMRNGNRIYLPANALGEEWLVRHEMLHALLQRGIAPHGAVRGGLPPRVAQDLAGLHPDRGSPESAGPLTRPSRPPFCC